MKKYFLIIIMLFIGLQDILAQHDIDTTLIQKSTSQGYSLNGDFLNTQRMKEVLLANDEASQVYQSALNSKGTAFTLMISGGVILLGGWIKDPSVGLFKVVGGIFILSAIPVYSVYYKRSDKAVEIYNNAIKQKNYPEKTVSIGLNSNGVGIQFNF